MAVDISLWKVYNQRQYNMNKPHNVKKLAESLKYIQKQGRQNQPECKTGLMKNFEPLLRQSNNSSSSAHGSDMSYIQKNSIKDYARDLIAKVKSYREKSISLFKIELSKYQSYYRQIQDMINEHYKEGKHKIEFEGKRMLKMFEEWKESIELLTQEIQIRYYDHDYEDKVKHFQKIMRNQVDVIEIKFPQLDSFKKALQKYLLSPKQLGKQNKGNKQNEQTFTACLKKDQKTQTSNTQKAFDNSPKIMPQTPHSKPASVHSEPDALLGCDEEFGATTSSANTLRRRKYDVGRQNVIKQEDESDDTISNVSDS